MKSGCSNSNSNTAPLLGTLIGAVLCVALWKFGNPVIFGGTGQNPDLPANTVAPWEAADFIYGPWPIAWAYVLLAVVCLAAVAVWRRTTTVPKTILLLPAIWLAWQCVATVDSLDRTLSFRTLPHFAACTVWFYLGVFALTHVRALRGFRIAIFVGFVGVMAVGFYQHYYGFAETREFFYQLPNWRDYPSAFMDKLASNRIYGTLFYPNALAGIILLLLPFVIFCLVDLTRLWERSARVCLILIVAAATLACLYWSESKAGWLIMLLTFLVAFCHGPVSRKVRVTVVILFLGLGLGAFFVKFSGYFARGATSVTARFDYWRAASQIVRQHPLTGSGPGTFMILYRQLKDRKAEMTRLVHNDYLQQGAESGVPGLLVYVLFTVGSLLMLYPGRMSWANPERFSLWLGLLGYSLQSFLEFGLYIPATAWCYFLFLGWLWGLRPAPSLTRAPTRPLAGP